VFISITFPGGTMNKRICELAFINARSIVTSELFLKTGLIHTSPTQIIAQINDKCNSRCVMCGCWRENKTELSADQWNEGFKQLKSVFGKFKICFSGGEVLLKEDFFKILEFCAREGLLFGMTTNGITFNDITIKKFIDLNPININFSLDSLDETNYRKLRGVPCLETVKSNIQKTIEYKRKVSSDMVITIKTVVTSKNIHELCQIAEYSKNLGIHGITFDMVKRRRFFGVENNIQEFEELFLMENSSIDKTVNELIEMKRAGYKILNSEQSMKQWGKENIKTGIEICQVPLKNLYIDSQGDIQFCENIDIIIGNINDSDLKLKLKSSSKIKREMVTCKEPCNYCIKRNLRDYINLFLRYTSSSKKIRG